MLLVLIKIQCANYLEYFNDDFNDDYLDHFNVDLILE